MFRTIVPAVRLCAVTLVATGVLYPLAVTGAAQTLFSRAANGSLLRADDGTVVGSELIGQAFASPAYLHGRPSAAGSGYDAASSGGSNLGPTSAALRDRATSLRASLLATNPDAQGPVPPELVTASASGLDPHVSPAAAAWQVPRIAAARKIDAARVRAVVDELTEGRTLGFLGEPRVNVLRVNLALDRRFGRTETR